MPIKKMSDYLPTKTADYVTETLNIPPQNTLQEQVERKQIVHEFDDGSVDVHTIGNIYFVVTLQWDSLSQSDAGTIFDLWNLPAKANGRKKTFYWDHPIDDKTYVVRFMSPLTRVDEHARPGRQAIQSVTLRVEGVKA